MPLRQTVDEALQPRCRRVLCSVPSGIQGRISQAEIGRAVYDVPGQLRVAAHVASCLTVGHGQVQQVGRFQGVRVPELQGRGASQVGMKRVNVATRLPGRCDLGDLHVGVEEQQAQQFSPDVAATTHNAHSHAV